MTRVLHLLDADCHETHAQVLEILRARLAEEGGHLVAACDAVTLARLAPHIGAPVTLVAKRFFDALNLAPSLRNLIDKERVDVIHAWGPRAAATAHAAAPHKPLLLTMLDPSAAGQTAKMLSSIGSRAFVVTGTQRSLSLLLTAGVNADQVTVIRGPADFGAINRAKQEGIREQLVGDAWPVVVVHGPAVRGHGHFEGVWACAIVRQIFPNIRVILPYASAERSRVRRFAERMTSADFPVLPDSHMSWAEIMSAADVFLVPAMTDVCTEPLGVAMASGVVCVGCAVHSVAEVIADRHNGLLSRDATLQNLAGRVLTAIEDKAIVRQVTDVARSQAFEVFGVRAFVDNYARVYQNLLDNQPIGEGVSDTAMVS